MRRRSSVASANYGSSAVGLTASLPGSAAASAPAAADDSTQPGGVYRSKLSMNRIPSGENNCL